METEQRGSNGRQASRSTQYRSGRKRIDRSQVGPRSRGPRNPRRTEAETAVESARSADDSEQGCEPGAPGVARQEAREAAAANRRGLSSGEFPQGRFVRVYFAS